MAERDRINQTNGVNRPTEIGTTGNQAGQIADGVPSTAPNEMVSLDATTEVPMGIWKKLHQLPGKRSATPLLWLAAIPLISMLFLVSLLFSFLSLNTLWLGMLLIASIQLMRVHTEQGYVQDASLMAPYDMRWVGALAQALESPHPHLRGVAKRLLIHLLPHLTPDMAYLLTRTQRSYLLRVIAQNRAADFELSCAILKAWGAMGLTDGIATIEALALTNPISDRKKIVRDAARECVEAVEARQEMQRIQEQAASLPPEQADNLLQQAQLSASTRAAIAEADTQLETLRDEQRKHSNPGMRMGFLIASWVIIVPYLAAQTYFAWANGAGIGWILLWGVLTLVATQLHRLSLSSTQTDAARRLADTDDIRAVGPLAEALEWPDSVVQQTAEIALTRLLPRLTATDGNLLNAKQRGILYSGLRMHDAHRRYQLIKATLKALQQVGDQAAIPVVEKLSQSTTYGERQREIKQLALDTLPLLTISARNQSVSSQLLRASSAIDHSSETLLRSSMTLPETAPEELLRAMNVEGTLSSPSLAEERDNPTGVTPADMRKYRTGDTTQVEQTINR